MNQMVQIAPGAETCGYYCNKCFIAISGPVHEEGKHKKACPEVTRLGVSHKCLPEEELK